MPANKRNAPPLQQPKKKKKKQRTPQNAKEEEHTVVPLIGLRAIPPAARSGIMVYLRMDQVHGWRLVCKEFQRDCAPWHKVDLNIKSLHGMNLCLPRCLRDLRLLPCSVPLEDEFQQVTSKFLYLQCLSLRNVYFTEAQFAVVAQLQLLVRLDVHNCAGLTDAAMVHIAALPNLKHLDMSSCHHVTNDGMKLLATSQLEDLDIGHCTRLLEPGLLHLAQITSLQRLGFSSMYCITANGFARIMQELKSLVELDLTGNNLSDAAFECLAALRMLCRLDLTFSHSLSDVGLAHLIAIPSLQNLVLAHCRKITDNGLVLLANASKLVLLDLSGCAQLTAVGVAHLMPIPSLRIRFRGSFMA